MLKQFLFLILSSLCLVTGCAQKGGDKNDYLVTSYYKDGLQIVDVQLSL